MIVYTAHSNPARSIDHDALCARSAASGTLLARAETDGDEGYYAEVARWSTARQTWERLCFVKFLGGEDAERPGWTAKQLAAYYADAIGNAPGPDHAGLRTRSTFPSTPGTGPDLDCLPIIRGLPSVSDDETAATFAG
jgi:hypothetical protein